MSQTIELYEKIFSMMIDLKEESIASEVNSQFSKIQGKISEEIDEHFSDLVGQIEAIKKHVKQEAKQKLASIQE